VDHHQFRCDRDVRGSESPLIKGSVAAQIDFF